LDLWGPVFGALKFWSREMEKHKLIKNWVLKSGLFESPKSWLFVEGEKRSPAKSRVAVPVFDRSWLRAPAVSQGQSGLDGESGDCSGSPRRKQNKDPERERRQQVWKTSRGKTKSGRKAGQPKTSGKKERQAQEKIASQEVKVLSFRGTISLEQTQLIILR